MKRLLYLFVVFLGATSAFAQDVSFVSTAGSVEFRATGHPSALHVAGKGAGPQGRIVVTPEDQVSGSASFDLNSLDTGISLRDEHMKTKYLEVAKYPQAQLTVTQLKLPHHLGPSFTEALAVPFQGILKLHGVEKPVSGTVNLKMAQGSELQTYVSFGIKLSDFGIEIPKYMGITIADEVQITVNETSKL